MVLANEDAEAKDFGEAVIYVYKCETGDNAVCCVHMCKMHGYIIMLECLIGVKVTENTEII